MLFQNVYRGLREIQLAFLNRFETRLPEQMFPGVRVDRLLLREVVVEEVVDGDARMPPQILGRRPYGFEGNQRRARKEAAEVLQEIQQHVFAEIDRKSTRLNSSHLG